MERSDALLAMGLPFLIAPLPPTATLPEEDRLLLLPPRLGLVVPCLRTSGLLANADIAGDAWALGVAYRCTRLREPAAVITANTQDACATGAMTTANRHTGRHTRVACTYHRRARLSRFARWGF